LVIVICLVFVFCYLKFFITETRTLTPEIFIFLKHFVRYNSMSAHVGAILACKKKSDKKIRNTPVDNLLASQ